MQFNGRAKRRDDAKLRATMYGVKSTDTRGNFISEIPTLRDQNLITACFNYDLLII